MGSSNSSKCPVPNLGVDTIKEKMIIYNHEACVVKRKWEEIRTNKKIDNERDKWFIDFIGIILEKLTDTERSNYFNDNKDAVTAINYIIKCDEKKNNEICGLFSNYSENFNYDLYQKMTNDEKNKIFSNFKLYVIRWFYQRVGSHRVLQLEFNCRRCSKSKTIEMDKTTSGKNINYDNNSYDPPQWWHWRKWPNNDYSFKEILRNFMNAPNYYNCKDFAHYIWDRVDGKVIY